MYAQVKCIFIMYKSWKRWHLWVFFFIVTAFQVQILKVFFFLNQCFKKRANTTVSIHIEL